MTAMAHQFPRSEVLLTGMGLQLQGRLQFGPIQVGTECLQSLLPIMVLNGGKDRSVFQNDFLVHKAP